MNDVETIKLTPVKRVMAQNMSKSWAEAPQFHLEVEVGCDKLIEFRKAGGKKISYMAVFIKALALAIEEYPLINSTWEGTHINQLKQINVGVAVDSKRGLLVPVIFDVANKSLAEVQAAMDQIKAKAERGNYKLEEISGGTITLSNLGMYDIDTFSSIVNHPEVAIISVGRMAKKVVVGPDDRPAIATMAKVVGNFDHRVIDGATGAKFLRKYVHLLENPELVGQ